MIDIEKAFPRCAELFLFAATAPPVATCMPVEIWQCT